VPTICTGKLPDGTRCSNPTTDASGNCGDPRHGAGFGARFRRRARAPLYDQRRWRRTSRAFRAEWVRRHGLVCGRCREPIPSFDQLHAGHIVAFEDGGARFDRDNLIGLCGACNARQSLHDRAHRRKR